MDLQMLNIDLFKKLSLAIVIIRNTPSGIKPDVFTRSLTKRLFPRFNYSNQFDEYLILRQQNLLTRFLSSNSIIITSSISMMDMSTLTSIDSSNNKNSINEYEFGEFAEKICKLKDKKYHMKIDDIEYLLNIIIKWFTKIDIDYRILPMDAYLYTIQLIANNLKTDNDKPYHIILDILPIIDKFLDCILEHITENNISYIHQMMISLASSNSCITRVMDKLCFRLCQFCENSEILDDYERQFISTIVVIDPIDRLFNILHEIIHNRSIFQSRLSQRTIDKLFTFISQISSLLDGKSNYIHILKLEGQLQAANYKQTKTTIKTFRSYTSSSSSDHSQYQQQKHYNIKALPPPSSKMNNFDYSMSQQSQS